MTLSAVLAGLGRLTLKTSTSTLVQTAKTFPGSFSHCHLLPSTTSLSLAKKCLLHTSPACFRIHDNRLRPHWQRTDPSSRTGRWNALKEFSERYEYTVRPLPHPRTGGRGPNGRIWNHKRGGGHKRKFRMIDWNRCKEGQEEDLLEKVDSILYDPNRSARIALVAGGEKKRYVIATQNMKAGDIIRSSSKLTKTAVRASEGDSHPVGSLPIGSIVNCVENYPGRGGSFARAAGVTAQLIKKGDETCVLRLPSKQEIVVASACQATLGRVSNPDHNKRVIGKAGRNRWLGIRPSSGRWHRKDGRFGRKIKPVPPAKVYDQPPRENTPVYKMTL